MQTDSDAEVGMQQASFALRFNVVVWFLTTGLQFFIGWWYRRQAVFYLPDGWFGPAEWWLALPFAPKGTSAIVIPCMPAWLSHCETLCITGSVSCATWQMACRRTIKSIETIVRQAVIERAPMFFGADPSQS